MRRAYRPARAAAASSSADWASLLAMAEACCKDAEAEGPYDQAAQLRLMTFRRRLRDTTTGIFSSECGYPAYQTANGWMEIARAFSAAQDVALRAALAPAVRAAGGFLESQIHAARQRAFEAAHRNRPEVNG